MIIPQKAFTGGEIGAAASARDDLQKYGSAVRRMENFIVLAQGGAINRPGWEFVCADITDTPNGSIDVDFDAEDGDSYVLEFSHLKMRIIRAGGLVVYPAGHPQAGEVVEVVTPFPLAALPKLKWTQSNDVMTFTHEDYAPRDLTRSDHHLWTFTTPTLKPSGLKPTGLEVVAHRENTGADGYSAETMRYRVTAIINGAETEPSAIGVSSEDIDLTAAGNYCVLTWTKPTPLPTGAIFDGYNVYKEVNSGGFYGYIGKAEKETFTDRNVQPNTNRSFQKALETAFDKAEEYPSVVEYHQQRRIFASTKKQPQTFWGTNVSQFSLMTASSPAQEDDAFEFTLANRKRQRVLHILSLNKVLILLTKSTEWAVRGRQTSVISAAQPPLVEPQSNYGAEDVRPLLVGAEALFVARGGDRVLSLGYSFEKDGIAAEDLTVLADHIFGPDRKLVSWAYAGRPHKVVWCVQSDGTMSALTYMREQQVWAWSRHPTDGFVERVTAIEGIDRTEVYITVRRLIGGVWKRYKERLRDRDVTDASTGFFVDSGLSYNGRRPITAFSLTSSPGKTAVRIEWPDAIPVGTEVDLVMHVLTVDGEKREFHRSVAVAETSTPQAGVQRMAFDVLPGGTFVRGEVQVRTKVISGLDHLEGRSIVALADGNALGLDNEGKPDGTLVVTGGQVTIPFEASLVHLGLQYVGEIETLDLEPPNAQGVSRTLAEVNVRMEKTRGLFAGADIGELKPFAERSIDDGYEAAGLLTGRHTYRAIDGWRQSGAIVFRQAFPLPACLLSIAPNFDFGR